MGLWSTKSISLLQQEAATEGQHTLKRALGALNLTTLGIGAIIGAGIFVLTGTAAAQYAGPAVSCSRSSSRDLAVCSRDSATPSSRR